MVRSTIPLLLTVAALLACRHHDDTPRGQADAQRDRCLVGAAFQQNPVAREIAANNCEQQASRAYQDIEHQENLQAVDDERQRQLDDEKRQRMKAVELARDQKLAAVRQSPSSPELGSTTMECRDVCASQEGELRVTRSDDVLLSCLVGGELIWVAEMRQGVGSFVVQKVKTLYESADVLKLREKVEDKLGPADSVEVVRDHRVWTWTRENVVMTVGSYPEGAFATLSEPERPE